MSRNFEVNKTALSFSISNFRIPKLLYIFNGVVILGIAYPVLMINVSTLLSLVLGPRKQVKRIIFFFLNFTNILNLGIRPGVL